MGPRTGLDGRKISSPPGFDPRLAAHSQELNRLSYSVHTHIYTDIYIYIYEISIHNSLVFSLEGRAWQEPDPSHVTGMALAFYPGQVLGGSLPLLSP